MDKIAALVAALGLGGCSFVYTLEEYSTEGAGGATAATTITGATGSAGSTSITSTTGAGGAPPCGTGEYLPAALLQETFDEGEHRVAGAQLGGADGGVEADIALRR